MWVWRRPIGKLPIGAREEEWPLGAFAHGRSFRTTTIRSSLLIAGGAGTNGEAPAYCGARLRPPESCGHYGLGPDFRARLKAMAGSSNRDQAETAVESSPRLKNNAPENPIFCNEFGVSGRGAKKTMLANSRIGRRMRTACVPHWCVIALCWICDAAFKRSVELNWR